MRTYEEDILYEKNNIEQVKKILSDFFIVQDVHSDIYEATDFKTSFTVKSFRVGLRLRSNRWHKRASDEFTIRWSRSSGVKTEIDKIGSGNCDYMLYGFLDESGEKIIKWFIGDLNVFREKNLEPLHIFNNEGSGDSQLAVYKKDAFGKDFIVAEYDKEYEDLINLLK